MKYLLMIIALSGCYEKSISRNKTNNSKIDVELLFEHDGCKIYRFVDGDYRYYAVCGSQAATNWQEDCSTDNDNPCSKNMQISTQRK